MVEILGSGVGEDEGISETGISHSVVPTLCGPEGSGRVGMGLRYDEIIVLSGHQAEVEVEVEGISGLVMGTESAQERRYVQEKG
jgi:hypothetical protein